MSLILFFFFLLFFFFFFFFFFLSLPQLLKFVAALHVLMVAAGEVEKVDGRVGGWVDGARVEEGLEHRRGCSRSNRLMDALQGTLSWVNFT